MLASSATSGFAIAVPVALWVAIAYAIAAIPVGLIIGRLRGIDLRATGSGNIGATNAVRALGRNWGLPVFGLDVLKAVVPVWLAARPEALGSLQQAPLWTAVVGFAALMGHIFPVYLRFRGGKGVACALGVFLVFCPSAGVVALILYLQTLWLTGISAVGSLTGVSAMTLFVVTSDIAIEHRVLVVIMATIIWIRHRSNLQQLRERRRAEKAAAARAS